MVNTNANEGGVLSGCSGGWDGGGGDGVLTAGDADGDVRFSQPEQRSGTRSRVHVTPQSHVAISFGGFNVIARDFRRV